MLGLSIQFDSTYLDLWAAVLLPSTYYHYSQKSSLLLSSLKFQTVLSLLVHPFYRAIVQESSSANRGSFIELPF